MFNEIQSKSMFNLKANSSTYFNDSLLKNVKFICENLNENYYFAINDRNQIFTIKSRAVTLLYDLNDDPANDDANNSVLNLNQDKNDHEVNQDKSDHEVNNRNEIGRIDDLIAFGHLPDLDLICLIYSTGLICTLNLDNRQSEKIDLGYRLVTADFSPECDKIVLTTESDKLVLLNSFFEQVNLSELNDRKQGAVDHLNVGWGKKETQFHGSEGKQARTAKKVMLIYA